MYSGIGRGVATLLGEKSGVEWPYFGEGIGMGDAAVGVVAGDHALSVIAWGDVGKDPVSVSVFGAVKHVGEDFLAVFYRIPEQAENTAGHVGVADQVVRLANEFGFLVTGNAEKNGVRVGDDAARVGFGDDDFVFTEGDFAAGDRCGRASAHKGRRGVGRKMAGKVRVGRVFNGTGGRGKSGRV